MCPCKYCHGEYWHDSEFLDRLQQLRDGLGRRIIVNSGHRCALHNARIGGAPLSEHRRLAVDMAVASHDRGKLLVLARSAGFTGFGFYQNFLHLDRGRARHWFGSTKARTLWANLH